VALYDGGLRMVDAQAQARSRGFDGRQVPRLVSPNTWRTGATSSFRTTANSAGLAARTAWAHLGRLNAAEKMSTPLAQQEFELFRKPGQGQSPWKVRSITTTPGLIENLYALERAQPTARRPGHPLRRDSRTTARPVQLRRRRRYRGTARYALASLLGRRNTVGSKRSTSSLPPATTTTP
jgi:coenzyme F420-reducing hydrogenase alpha subunit